MWDPALYESKHDFVWKYGGELVDDLNPQKGEMVLDLGCGSGHLTAAIAGHGAIVTGLDSSPAMIGQARQNFPGLSFMLADARSFSLLQPADAIFSNAALHWIEPPEQAAHCIAAALRPGGRLIAEFGGRGNVARIYAAVRAVAGNGGDLPYFPSIAEYSAVLEKAGLEVVYAHLRDRPTRLEGQDGMENWLEMFTSQMIQHIPERQRDSTRKSIVERLRPEMFRDGVWWADYRRLRVHAIKM